MIGSGVVVGAVATGMFRDGQRSDRLFLYASKSSSVLAAPQSSFCNKFSPCEVIKCLLDLVHPFLTQNPGIPPVDMVRDPRIGRLWTKYKETDLPVPKFKVSAQTECCDALLSVHVEMRGAVKSCRHTPHTDPQGCRFEFRIARGSLK